MTEGEEEGVMSCDVLRQRNESPLRDLLAPLAMMRSCLSQICARH